MNTQEKIWLIFQGDCLLMQKTDNSLTFFSDANIQNLHQSFLREHLIDEMNHCIIHCAELPTNFFLPENIKALPLRKAFEQLGQTWHKILARAILILNWDKNHQFCGRCRHETKPGLNLFERICPNCSTSFYPRISPSIIVRINRNDEILMARGHHFQPGVFALIAGFVEAGESVEEAVHREVMEEVNIKIKNLRYFGSQSWPFPDSLMFAFAAEYESGEIKIDAKEIEAAGWYHYNHLPGRPSSSISIASQLIQDFIQQKQKS